MWYVYINRTSKDAPFSFEDLLSLQEKVLSELSPVGGKALLFAELSPTITLGARQMNDSMQVGSLQYLRERLKEKGVAVVAGERGGKETWHGPGQWVGFVLTSLQDFTGDAKGVRKAVYQILENLLKVVLPYHPSAKIEEGDRLGIWSDLGKLVSVGIKIKSNYVTSGFSVNCFPTKESFLGINPCGIEGSKPDYLFLRNLPENQWQSEFEKIVKEIVNSF